MNHSKLLTQTNGEGFYDITSDIKTKLSDLNPKNKSGLLNLFITHTSCALTISESYDSSAKSDMENFLKHIAPRNLSFITHTAEGPDDSPSHMKSLLLNQQLGFIVEEGELILGTWQGVYLAEFRDSKKQREILIKFSPDQ